MYKGKIAGFDDKKVLEKAEANIDYERIETINLVNIYLESGRKPKVSDLLNSGKPQTTLEYITQIRER